MKLLKYALTYISVEADLKYRKAIGALTKSTYGTGFPLIYCTAPYQGAFIGGYLQRKSTTCAAIFKTSLSDKELIVKIMHFPLNQQA